MRLILWLMTAVPAVIAHADGPTPALREESGYRGIWYANQPQNDQYRYKYSGGFATYPQQHIPMAVYAPDVNKTFFCYGGAGDREGGAEIRNMVSYYDHATGQVPRPRVVLSRGTNDAHYNPTLAIDGAGHIYVFCNSHGQGVELAKDDPTRGRSFIYRSEEPYSIERFRVVHTDNFSYSQCWPAGDGLLWLHTRYLDGRRRLFWSGTRDGLEWSKPRQLTEIKQGSYQVSWADGGGRVATAFDHHPDAGGLNARTNIYCLQTIDAGKTWQTVGGKAVRLPLKDVQNAALVHDYQGEGLLVYLKDLAFDGVGNPVILYLTSRGYKSGPDAGPRQWWVARWMGRAWDRHLITESDHNYDHGSLYIEADGPWRVVAPTAAGPQPHTTGGAIEVHASDDGGRTWKRSATRDASMGRNRTYVRRPLHANEGFYAFWADGQTLAASASDLYFATRSGDVYRLPRQMSGERATPERVER